MTGKVSFSAILLVPLTLLFATAACSKDPEVVDVAGVSEPLVADVLIDVVQDGFRHHDACRGSHGLAGAVEAAR